MMNHPALKTALKLSAKVAIYVPGTNGVDTAEDTSFMVDRVASALSSMFGGASASAVSGYWLSDSVGLVKENTTVVYAFAAPAALADHLGDVVQLAQDIKRELKQEAVSLELGGSLYLI